jgi:hypothetical protein
MERLFYRSLAMGISVLGGLAAGVVFKELWKLVGRADDPPSATDAGRGWREVLVAATLEGAIFGFVNAAVDRCGAAGLRKLTGTWPGSDCSSPSSVAA